MRTFFKLTRNIILGLLLAVLSFGCGSASNNQGVSFTFLGFFTEFGDCGELPSSVVGISAPISSSSGISEVTTGNSESLGTESSISAIVGLQNNMETQFIRTQRMFLSYYIEGASTQPPDTAVALSTIVNPAATTSDSADTGGASASASAGSSLPGTFSNFCNRSFAQVPVVPAEIRTWLNLNRNSLPELPFTMVVTAYVTGLTSAGDRLDSNPVELFIHVTVDNDIAPTSSSADNNTTTN
ncbi:MAG: hypothetical protein D6719_01300 [Candidatus Dadabacteria bacterium]|nr:MAG: hypothetical protein D6719_01300 [Candidatus Dadabacteria bacterium]